jgi:hypothetical protein
MVQAKSIEKVGSTFASQVIRVRKMFDHFDCQRGKEDLIDIVQFREFLRKFLCLFTVFIYLFIIYLFIYLFIYYL